MISTDSANETGLSILLRTPSHSSWVQSQTSGLIEWALLIYYSLEPRQPCLLADAKAPFRLNRNLPLQFPPSENNNNK